VGAHAADIAREGGDGQAVLAVEPEAVLSRYVPGRARRSPDFTAPGPLTVAAPAPGPSERSCASARATGSSMFFTCAPGGSETVGPTSNIATEASAACSLRMRAYAAPVGPLPTMTTSTASG